ncbi:MAG: hypothetical protein ACO3KY_03745 [Lysobacterales bacterium]
MNSAVTPLSAEGAASTAPVQSSRLLPSLFDQIQADRRITVLDVGPAVPETVRFFSQYTSRLHICDLFEERLVREQQDDFNESEMRQAFTRLLRLPRGTLIDICLFWDFPNYLKPHSLRALGAALKPYLHPGTRGHGFSVLNVNTPLSNLSYGIVRPDALCSRPSRHPQMGYFPHTHEALSDCLGHLKIERGWLLADGRLEMLLQARL